MLKLSEHEIHGLCLFGKARKVHFLWHSLLADPKDDHLLELAVSAGHAVDTKPPLSGGALT